MRGHIHFGFLRNMSLFLPNTEESLMAEQLELACQCYDLEVMGLNPSRVAAWGALFFKFCLSYT